MGITLMNKWEHDIWMHIGKVRANIQHFTDELEHRGQIHDHSKLLPPEREIFQKVTPLLHSLEFGSQEYQDALASMGMALDHHYQVNSHHAEHFSNGIDGMDLTDLTEMVCDWVAAADGKPINWEYVVERFHISPQLESILRNTVSKLQ